MDSTRVNSSKVTVGLLMFVGYCGRGWQPVGLFLGVHLSSHTMGLRLQTGELDSQRSSLVLTFSCVS